MNTGKIDALVAASVEEVMTKGLRQIQVETAYKWAARAIAAAQAGMFDDAREYAHEAIEHGALAGGSVLDEVRVALYRQGVEV